MAASNAFQGPSLSIQPALSPFQRGSVVPQAIQELNERADWALELLSIQGLLFAGAYPGVTYGFPLTLGNQGATGESAVIVNGLINNMGYGASFTVPVAPVAGVLTIPTILLASGLSVSKSTFRVSDAGAPTNITSIVEPVGITAGAGAKITVVFGAVATNNYTLVSSATLAVPNGSLALTGATAPIIPAGSTSINIEFLFNGTKWTVLTAFGNQ